MKRSPSGVLVRGQPFQPAPHCVLVVALDRVNVARAQERQQCQPGRGGVRLRSRRLERARRALTLVVEIKAPRTVGSLMPHDPVQAVIDRLLRPGRPPFAPQQLGASQALPAENGAETFSANPPSRIAPWSEGPLPRTFESETYRRCSRSAAGAGSP